MLYNTNYCYINITYAQYYCWYILPCEKINMTDFCNEESLKKIRSDRISA